LSVLCERSDKREQAAGDEFFIYFEKKAHGFTKMA
jgi:hypothetical protein